VSMDGVLPDVDSLRIPVRYLANLLTAGDEQPVKLALKRLLAMRAYKRAEQVDGVQDLKVLESVGLSVAQCEDMYRYLAIANYEDRFVIPTSHQEIQIDDYHAFQGQNGFSFGNDTSSGMSTLSLFPDRRRRTIPIKSGI